MKYEVIDENNLTALKKRVNAALKKGWRPVGGIAISEDEVAFNYAQAMMLETDNEV